MKTVLSWLLVTVLLASAVPLAVMPAGANPAGIPGDTDGDDKLTEAELASAICSYLLAEEGHLELEVLLDAAFVYAYWDGAPRTITDSATRNVAIYKPIKRIVVLNSDAGEAVKILGAADKIVGIVDSVQKKTFYFPETSKKPLVGTWEEVEWEEVVNLNPDLVVTYTKYGAKVEIAEEKLSPFGIPVAGLDLYDPNHIPTELSKLSILLESEERASKYIKWYDEYKTLIEEVVGGKERPQVFITSTKAIGETDEIPTYGSGTTDNELCEMTEGINIAGNLKTKYPKVSAEWVLGENPDIIIMKASDIYGWDSETEPKNMIDDLLEGKGWDNLNATKNNRVYVVPWSAIYGMEQPFAMTLFVKIFHPELDIDPTGVYKDFLGEFMGDISYPEDKIFVYPEV